MDRKSKLSLLKKRFNEALTPCQRQGVAYLGKAYSDERGVILNFN